MKTITPIPRLIVSAACVALAASSYAFFYRGSADRHTNTVEAIEQLESVQRDNVKLVQLEAQLRREVDGQKAQYHKIQKILRKTYRREEMLNRLGDHLKQAGITLKRYTPLSTPQSDGSTPYYHNQLSFEATFHQLMDFLARCKDMPLVMSIDNIQLNQQPNSQDNRLKIILTYSIYAGQPPAGETAHDK